MQSTDERTKQVMSPDEIKIDLGKTINLKANPNQW